MRLGFHFKLGGDGEHLAQFVAHVRVDYLPHSVLIDCTASEEVARHYRAWLASGIHIVTPNKKANSASWESYRGLHEARRVSRAHYLYEATVGAGLPVIQTLRDLRVAANRADLSTRCADLARLRGLLRSS